MKIAVLKETQEFEARVAATPEVVKKLMALGATVVVEKGAGIAASQEDSAYQAVGATLAANAKEAVQDADVVLCVQTPQSADGGANVLDQAKANALVIGMLAPYQRPKSLKKYADAKLTTFSMELVPRITRAQSMDVLSSQTNLAGYRAVLEAAFCFSRAFPMMMTAAGTIAPAKVLILGAGVAGLQAIATARRLGAAVSAFDVRAAAREQVESLGATFIAVESDENLETAGGYAKETTEAYKQKQAEKIAESLKKADIAITTALIPGKAAPRLITAAMVADMRPGSVIVDMAVESGGNCELSQLGQVVEKGGVKIIGYANLPSRLATDASMLYAKNVLNFITLLIDKETKSLKINWEDDIIKGTALTHQGKIIHPTFAQE